MRGRWDEGMGDEVMLFSTPASRKSHSVFSSFQNALNGHSEGCGMRIEGWDED